MCLAIPMQVVALDGCAARCSARGVERLVNTSMLAHETLERGDYVMVHVGYAISKILEEDAVETWRVIDEALEREDRLAAR